MRRDQSHRNSPSSPHLNPPPLRRHGEPCAAWSPVQQDTGHWCPRGSSPWVVRSRPQADVQCKLLSSALWRTVTVREAGLGENPSSRQSLHCDGPGSVPKTRLPGLCCSRTPALPSRTFIQLCTSSHRWPTFAGAHGKCPSTAVMGNLMGFPPSLGEAALLGKEELRTQPAPSGVLSRRTCRAPVPIFKMEH